MGIPKFPFGVMDTAFLIIANIEWWCYKVLYGSRLTVLDSLGEKKIGCQKRNGQINKYTGRSQSKIICNTANGIAIKNMALMWRHYFDKNKGGTMGE